MAFATNSPPIEHQARAPLATVLAGAAHQLRNPLYAIALNLHVLNRCNLRSDSLPEEELQEMLEQSAAEVRRAEQVISQMLALFTPDPPQNEVVNLCPILKERAPSILRELDHQCDSSGHVQLQLHLPEEEIWVAIDPGRLEQMLEALLRQAHAALAGPGVIRLALEQDGERNQATLQLADSGEAIASEHLPRVFEPFFAARRGKPGVELALVANFASELGGKVDCQNNALGGATFSVSLPLVYSD